MKQDTLTAMLDFARAHDWGRNSLISYRTNALHLYDSFADEVIRFHDMATLRAWAGY
jgi:hypothetical protein